MRLIWLALGFFSLGLALLGIALPLLPTVPFLLLSAFLFSKSSQRFHDWLLGHKTFGKMIKDWNERGVINRKAKYLSTVSIGAVLSLSVLLHVEMIVIYIQIFVLSLALLFIWTRPDR